MEKSTLYDLDGGWTLRALEAMNGDLFGGLGIDPWYPERWEENPISRILKDDDLWEILNQRVTGVSGTSLLRGLVICQQLMWHFGRFGKGPEGDGQSKTLRKHWYAYAKEGIQYISNRMNVWRLNETTMNGTAAAGALSQVYSELVGDVVDSNRPTYLDLFVKDGSRQFTKFESWQVLPEPLGNIIFCIEKDAAYEDCCAIGKALGVRAAVSGGGKMGKAGTERMVRECLSNYFDTPTPGDLVTWDNPLYVMAETDWDYDGGVIAETFPHQLERYINPDMIKYVRVGIKPQQVQQLGYSLDSKWYELDKFHNSAYTTWAVQHALFSANGGVASTELGDDLSYYTEENPYDMGHPALKKLFETLVPHGYELDALKRVEYAELIIEGLLTMISWEDLIDALSCKAWSDPEQVTEDLTTAVLRENGDYQELDQHISELREQFEELVKELEGKKDRFRDNVREEIQPLVEGWKDDERITRNDREATQDKLATHLRLVQAWEHWQPFDKYQRNSAHQEVVEQEEKDALDELKQRSLYFDKVTF